MQIKEEILIDDNIKTWDQEGHIHKLLKHVKAGCLSIFEGYYYQATCEKHRSGPKFRTTLKCTILMY